MLSKNELKYFSFIITDREGNQLSSYDFQSLGEAIKYAKKNEYNDYLVMVCGTYEGK